MEFLTGGALIKDIRRSLKITQKELAMDSISVNTISMIENGLIKLNYVLALLISENLNKIALFKGIKIDITAKCLLETEFEKCLSWCDQELLRIELLPDSLDKVKEYKNVLSAIKNISCSEKVSQIHEKIANVLYRIGKYNEAFDYYSYCLNEYKSMGYIYKVIDTYNNLGMSSYYRDIEESYKYHHEAYELLKNVEINEKTMQLRNKVIYYIALYHAKKGSFACADSYLDDIKQYNCSDYDLSVRIQILYGNIKLRMQEYDKAIHIFNSILNAPEDIVSAYKYMIYNNIGICYNYLGDLENSIRYLELAIKLQLDEDHPDLTNALVHLCKVHIKCGKYDIALRYIDGALNNSLKFKQNDYIIECYYYIYIISKFKEMYSKCEEALCFIKDFIKDHETKHDYINRYNLLRIDYLLAKNEIDTAKSLLNDIVMGKEVG